jgi:hypothetical protein
MYPGNGAAGSRVQGSTMRVLPALVASIAAHGAVFLGIRTVRVTPPRLVSVPPRVELLPAAPASPEPTPVEIIVLPELAPAAAPPALPADAAAGAGSRISTGRARGARPAETGSTTGGDGTKPSAEPAGSSGGMLTMRREPKKQLSLDGVDLGAIALARPNEAVLPVAPSGLLRPAGGGDQAARSGGVTMKVAPDGDIDFESGNAAKVSIAVPTPAEVLGGPDTEQEEAPIQDLPQHEQAVEGGWNSGSRGGGASIGGGFDITSLVMSKLGMDPDQARKQKLMEETYEERAGQRAVHTDAQLRDADKLVRKTLVQLWRATTDPVERRQALFELWDECEEGDGARAEAGARVRRQVLGWIRAKLPAGSRDAYTDDEVARLNAARRSSQPFKPYSQL